MHHEVDKHKMPKHVAIIMDGNGRWAKARGKERLEGHRAGAESVRRVLEVAVEYEIKYITLYAFSTENWHRPKDEVDGLMNLMLVYLGNELSTLIENKVRLSVIGDLQNLSQLVRDSLTNCMKETENNKGPILTLAISYSARWEILNAAKGFASHVKEGVINVNELDEAIFGNYLSTRRMPDPDLLIRTSGELRISNFLLWQLAYSELYFTEVLWPDFSKEHFYEALYEYQQRERRLGKTSEQIAEKNN